MRDELADHEWAAMLPNKRQRFLLHLPSIRMCGQCRSGATPKSGIRTSTIGRGLISTLLAWPGRAHCIRTLPLQFVECLV
jgi:hypothetical protein